MTEIRHNQGTPMCKTVGGRLFCATALVGSLAGCAAFNQASSLDKQASAAIAANPAPTASAVQQIAAPYLLGDPIKMPPPVNPVLLQPATLMVGRPETVNEIAGQVAQMTGIAVSVNNLSIGSDGLGGMSSSSPNAGLPPPPSALFAAATSSDTSPRITIRYPSAGQKGTLNGLMDDIASTAGMSWRLDNGVITLFKTESKTFTIPALNTVTVGSNQIVASAGANAQSGGSGTGTTTNDNSSTGSTTVTDSSTVDVWKGIAATAKTISGGAEITVDPSTATLTVTGTPDQIQQVADWVEDLSGTLEKQVAVTVHIYNVQLTNEQNYGFNPTLAFENAAKSFGVSVAGANAPAVQSTTATPLSFGASILNTATGAAGEFAGTQAAVQALDTLGHVDQIFSRSIVTLNDQPAPIQVATQTGYLAESSISTTANVGTQASLTPGSVTTGFTGTITPLMVGNKILLRLDITISSLVALTTVSSGGSSIQTPTTTDTVVEQSTSLHSGSTLMITGYQESDGQTTNNGVGSPYLPLLGGGGDAQVKKNLIAIVVTARTL